MTQTILLWLCVCVVGSRGSQKTREILMFGTVLLLAIMLVGTFLGRPLA